MKPLLPQLFEAPGLFEQKVHSSIEEHVDGTFWLTRDQWVVVGQKEPGYRACTYPIHPERLLELLEALRQEQEHGPSDEVSATLYNSLIWEEKS